jgi:serine/threonine protein kinase
LARKSKKKTSGFFNSTKKTPVSLTAHSFIECNANTCKPVVLTFGATNNSKGTAKFSVDTPVDLHNRYFLSVNAPNGTIDKGKAVQFQIAVVLYKPICLKRLVTIRFELEEGEEIYHIPIQVGVSRAALKHDTPQDPFWTITKDEYQMDSRIGGGASASVFTASLYGATVAVKKWDLGKKDDPPRDFLAELDVYKQLRHENLVLFIGAMSETGTAVLVTEFLKNGSLDNFLQKNKDRKPFKLKLNMAIDAAKGMRYVHSHNKIHRDMKSLNLLVDEVFKVKVTDFGESREKDANMTQATGTYNWMAPEVLMSQNYTMKADVFSFGIILWGSLNRENRIEAPLSLLTLHRL